MQLSMLKTLMLHWMTGSTWLLPIRTHRTGDGASSNHPIPVGGQWSSNMLCSSASFFIAAFRAYVIGWGDGGDDGFVNLKQIAAVIWDPSQLFATWILGVRNPTIIRNMLLKAGMDLDTKNPSPHFWSTKPLWQSSGAFPPFAWSWSHPNGTNGCKKTSLVAQMMCIEILIYSYPMSGLFMVIFLHVPSKTTHMCAFSIISPWIQSSNHPNLPVEGRLDHHRPDLQISSSLSTGIL